LVTGEIALTALKLLWERSDKEQRDILDNDGLVTLIALADPSEAWATPTTTALASQLLSEQLATLDVTDFLIQSILKGYLQKLFSKSRPTTVTASGRKAEYQDDDLDRQQGLPDDSRQTKPWKYEDLRSIPVLAWAVEQADVRSNHLTSPSSLHITNPSKQESLIWPLYIPPLITLLDDPLTRIRARGLRLAASFLSKFPATKLRMTGLASVFEEAIFPTLNYLPSLTPERESILLLDPAFDALLVLARKLADPAAAADGKEGEEGSRRESRKLLDRILRGGVFAAFFHAGQHVAIVEVLMRKTSAVVAELGVHAVKHLKDLVPMFYGVLTEPFAFSHAVALRAAVGALQVTVENCWPRLVEGVWQEEMVRMLVVCWVHSLDLDDVRQGGKLQDQDREDVRKELRKTALMLCAVAKTSGVDLAEKVATLITKEPAIAGLFAVSG
jgi:hypothetical protein